MNKSENSEDMTVKTEDVTKENILSVLNATSQQSIAFIHTCEKNSIQYYELL